MCVCSYIWRPEVSLGGHFSGISTFERGSLNGLELTLHVCTNAPRIFMQVLGIALESSCLGRKRFTNCKLSKLSLQPHSSAEFRDVPINFSILGGLNIG